MYKIKDCSLHAISGSRLNERLAFVYAGRWDTGGVGGDTGGEGNTGGGYGRQDTSTLVV